jgi:hypothetical protein
VSCRSLVVVILALAALSPPARGAPTRPITVVTPTPLAELWRRSSQGERALLAHLTAAARAVRPVVFFQTHRHALAIRRVLHAAFEPERRAATARLLGEAELRDLVAYAAAFLVKRGPYEEFTNRKLRLTVLGPERLRALWAATPGGARTSPRELDEIVRLMTDPAFEAHELPAPPAAADLPATGGNLYEHGLTLAEVADVAAAPGCRVVRGPGGRPVCQRLAAKSRGLDPEVRAALRETVAHLRQAAAVAGSRWQKRQLAALARYLERGAPRDAALAERALVAGAGETPLLLYAAFLYTMYDPRGQLGKLELTVMAVEPETTRLLRGLAGSAGHFEARFPYGRFRRELPAGGGAPAILLARPVLRGGPGAEDPGLHVEAVVDGRARALNLVPVQPPEVVGDPVFAADLGARLGRFVPAAEVEAAVRLFGPAVTALVLLHELIGHGSGTVDPARYGDDDPSAAMGPEGVSLEELRANLAALSILLDPRLVELGLAADAGALRALARAWIDQYVTTTAVLAARRDPFSWPHMRAALLLVTYWLDEGALVFDGTRFSIPDLDRLIAASTALLEVAQRVRATRDEAELGRLYARYAPADPSGVPWVAAVAGRADDLPEGVVVIQRPFHVTNEGLVFLGDPADLAGLIPEL